MPESRSFGPDDCGGSEDTTVSMGLDEYETLRLIDLLGYTQDECAGQMGVARTTVQAVYNSARKKLADMLVNGKDVYKRQIHHPVSGTGKYRFRAVD